MALLSYEEAYAWLAQAATRGEPALLLGNGISVAFDRDRFSYKALRTHAVDRGSIGPLSGKFFEALDTYDFEFVIRQLQDAARALRVLDATKYAAEIDALELEATQLKETLAQSLASLHPERPGDIPDAA